MCGSGPGARKPAGADAAGDEPVERLTGRKVRAFVSGLDAVADGLAVELFVLHPQGYDGPSRRDSQR